MKTNAYIYVMQAEDGTLKLGHSKDPAKRAKQVGRPVEVVHTTDLIEQVERIERVAHRVLALHGRHIRGEWFEAKLSDAVAAIETAIRQAEGLELPLVGRLSRPDMHDKPPREALSIWLPVELKAALQKLADRENRSLTNYIETKLRDVVKAEAAHR